MVYGEGNPNKIILVDYGVKENMIRNLVRVWSSLIALIKIIKNFIMEVINKTTNDSKNNSK